jgi:signal peptidase
MTGKTAQSGHAAGASRLSRRDAAAGVRNRWPWHIHRVSHQALEISLKLFARAVAALLALVLLSLVGGAVFAWSHGYRLYAVKTGSMTPTYRPGDLVIDAVPDGHYPVGSVVTFRPASGGAGVTTHRVHARSADGLSTKGDANRTPDVSAVAADNVVGRVVAGVPRAGYVLVFFQQPAGIASTMTLALSVVLSWSLFFPASRRPEDSAVTETTGRIPALA